MEKNVLNKVQYSRVFYNNKKCLIQNFFIKNF